MTKEQILQMDTKKHVKIYKLSQAGLTNKEIAAELSTNTGHVYNVLKAYANSPEKQAKANLTTD